MKYEMLCDWCGNKFERKKGQIKPRNYCNRSCLGKANAARFLKKRMKICENCGKEYEGNNKHRIRNKHFFCSMDCASEYKTKKGFVNCDWCEKPLLRKRSDIARNNHNFCDSGCYIDFINFAEAGAKEQRVCGKSLYRILAEMDLGRELDTKEQVHHIDGNHHNHDSDNLLVLSSSDHSKIHASKKERDDCGRFIKQT